jgi:RNA-directed DNA polymerase
MASPVPPAEGGGSQKSLISIQPSSRKSSRRAGQLMTSASGKPPSQSSALRRGCRCQNGRIVFGRFAAERMAEKAQKPSEFNFLGFRHICGIDRAGKFALVRLPVQKSISRFLEDTKKWLWEHMHWKVRDQGQKLSEKLQGFYGYYALPHCGRKLYAVYGEVLKQWRSVLKRRSQRSQTHWSYLASQSWFTLPTPRSLHIDV